MKKHPVEKLKDHFVDVEDVFDKPLLVFQKHIETIQKKPSETERYTRTRTCTRYVYNWGLALREAHYKQN